MPRLKHLKLNNSNNNIKNKTIRYRFLNKSFRNVHNLRNRTRKNMIFFRMSRPSIKIKKPSGYNFYKEKEKLKESVTVANTKSNSISLGNTHTKINPFNQTLINQKSRIMRLRNNTLKHFIKMKHQLKSSHNKTVKTPIYNSYVPGSGVGASSSSLRRHKRRLASQ